MSTQEYMIRIEQTHSNVVSHDTREYCICYVYIPKRVHQCMCIDYIVFSQFNTSVCIILYFSLTLSIYLSIYNYGVDQLDTED